MTLSKIFLPTALADLAPWSRLPAEWSDDVRHGLALHGSVQGVHGVAGRDGTVSGRCILVHRRLHIQSPRKWTASADFRELAWTAVCECASRRYIHGQTDGRFIGQYFLAKFKWNLGSQKSPRRSYPKHAGDSAGRGLTFGFSRKIYNRNSFCVHLQSIGLRRHGVARV